MRVKPHKDIVSIARNKRITKINPAPKKRKPPEDPQKTMMAGIKAILEAMEFAGKVPPTVVVEPDIVVKAQSWKTMHLRIATRDHNGAIETIRIERLE